MKIIQRIVIALAIMFATMVTAQAETDLSKHTYHDGQAAINAIDAMGLETIPRKELEEVRGEVAPVIYYVAVYGVPTAVWAAGAASRFNAPMVTASIQAAKSWKKKK